jgi:hypothetical protein
MIKTAEPQKQIYMGYGQDGKQTTKVRTTTTQLSLEDLRYEN